MIVGTEHKLVKPLRPDLDKAVIKRLKELGDLEPYSDKWHETYYEASKPVWAIKDRMREILWVEYQRLWGKNSTGSYFLPQHILNREEQLSIWRVSQKLAKGN